MTGADDGELFLEYRQSEGLGFDNGRLKQATYDTAQGFGLRAVKDDAVGYAQGLYANLRTLDAAATSVILVETPPTSTPWDAVNDRLTRAATGSGHGKK